MSGLPPAGAQVRLAEAPVGEVLEHMTGADGIRWALVSWPGYGHASWHREGTLVEVAAPLDPVAPPSEAEDRGPR